MEPIIKSILETDLYKLTMQQAVFHQYPSAMAKYVFKCRNADIKLGFIANKVHEQIKTMKDLSLTKAETNYLEKSMGHFLASDYIQFLKSYRFNPDEVIIEDFAGDLNIMINGSWMSAILWEVPLLAIVNQVYFEETTNFDSIRETGEIRLRNKLDKIYPYPRFTLTDFGTRRRYSADWQRWVVEHTKKTCPQFVGTSNVKLAMDLDTKAIGTCAHEWFSAHLALVDKYEEAQKRALHVWLQEYNTQLGHALSDTFTTDAFLRDFREVLARSYQGVRHDSGNPIEFGYKIIDHYKKLGIDPKTKSIVFSDGLDIPKALEIYSEFTGLIGLGFGVGTNLTNDMGVEPLNIVIKLVECNGHPVVKLSDNVTKAIGDKQVIESVKKAYGL